MKIRVIVAAHKAYRMPEDPMYLPLHVGKAGKELELGFQGDNTGENISEKNPSFCELTGIYWAWKNLDADYVGLAGTSGEKEAGTSGTASSRNASVRRF